MWASGGFGRNRNKRGEWNYAIDAEATEKTLDWKAFLGNAPKRPFTPERYFRWRKYWDYSGGIATDLFYHTVSPLLVTIGPEFPHRVTAGGGIYAQHDREVPDTFFMNVDYPKWTMQLACSVGSGVGAPLVIHGSEGTIFVARDSESLDNTEIEVVPDREYKDDFVKKTGSETVKIAVQPFAAARTRTWTTSSTACAAARRRTWTPRPATAPWRPSAWASARIAAARSSSSTRNGNG